MPKSFWSCVLVSTMPHTSATGGKADAQSDEISWTADNRPCPCTSSSESPSECCIFWYQSAFKILTIKSKNLRVIIIIATLGKCLELPTSQADPRWRGQGHLKRNLRAGERTPSRGMHTPRTSTTMPKSHAGPRSRWNVIEFASSQKLSIFSDILLHFAALWVGRPGRLEGGGVREEGLRWPTVGWGGPNPTGPFSTLFIRVTLLCEEKLGWISVNKISKNYCVASSDKSCCTGLHETKVIANYC